jgi:hypothetical protein
MTRRAVVTLAAVALGVGVFVSSLATAAAPACGNKSCSEEIAARCAGLTGMAAKTCSKSVIDQCNTGTCTCTGEPGLPVCGTIQCCVQSSPMGAFDTCTVETPAQCAAQGGMAQGSGTCSPNPCSTSTTSTTTSTSSTTCPTGTAFYCGMGPACGGGTQTCGGPFPPLCPSGMTCTTDGTTCGCTGEAIPCGDPRLTNNITCNFCQWGTCPPGMTCGAVPISGACGFECACH